MDEAGYYGVGLDDDERELIRRHRESKGRPDDEGRADHEPQHADSSNSSAKKKKRTIVIVGVAVILLAGLGIGLAIGLGGSPSSPTNGFYNMQTLAQSVQQQIDQSAMGGSQYSTDTTVTGCSMSGAHTALCTLGNTYIGEPTGITVLISNDGSTWSQQ